jgi:colicin import membrane protein
MATAEIENKTTVDFDLSVISYDVTETAITELAKKYSTIKAIKCPADYKFARSALSDLTKTRTSIEKRRKELKDGALKFGRQVDSTAKTLTASLEVIEDPIRKLVEEVDQREENERRAKEEAEKARIAAEEKAKKDAEDARIKAEREAEAEKNRIEAERLANERAEFEKLKAAKLEEARKEKEAADAALKAERQKIEDEQRAREKSQMAMQEINAIAQQEMIAVTGRLGVRAGGTIECMRETYQETLNWKITSDKFGDLLATANGVKERVLRAIETMIVSQERIDTVQRLKEEELKAAQAKIDAETHKLEEAKAEAARVEAARIQKIKDDEAAATAKALKEIQDKEQARLDAEAKAEADRIEAARLEALKPDKEKIGLFAAKLFLLEYPETSTDAGHGAITQAEIGIREIAEMLVEWSKK